MHRREKGTHELVSNCTTLAQHVPHVLLHHPTSCTATTVTAAFHREVHKVG